MRGRVDIGVQYCKKKGLLIIMSSFRDVEKVLSHKKETQELSNELTFHVLTVCYNFRVIQVQYSCTLMFV